MTTAGPEVEYVAPRVAPWTDFPIAAPLVFRCLLALSLVAAALAVRAAMHLPPGTLTFLTLYPAVGLAAVLLGAGPGLCAVFLSVLVSIRFLYPPLAEGVASGFHLLSVGTVAASGALLCVLVDRLHRTRSRLRESEVRLCGLLASSRVGIVLSDESGRVLDCNAAYRALLGLTPHEIGALDTRSLAPSGSAQEREATYELAGRRVPVRLSAVCFSPARKRTLTWTLVEDQSVERAARELNVRRMRELQAVAENPLIGMVLVGEHAVTWANDAFAKMFGYEKPEIIGQPFSAPYPDEQAYRRFREDIAPLLERGEVYRAVISQPRRDGALGWYSMSCTRVRRVPEELIATFVDITERRRLERALTDAEHDARRKLGADLHDGLGQELTSLSMLVGALRGHLADPAASERLLDKLQEIAGRAIDTCRSVARGLSPVGELNGGLACALRAMVGELAQAGGAAVRLEVGADAGADFPAFVLEQLYRIAQEGVNNARKHARAGEIVVRLDGHAGAVRLSVSDDGAGIDVPAATGGGMGMRIMRHRASLIGAELAITHGPDGRGTVVLCQCGTRRALPLGQPAANGMAVRQPLSPA